MVPLEIFFNSEVIVQWNSSMDTLVGNCPLYVTGYRKIGQNVALIIISYVAFLSSSFLLEKNFFA